MFPKYTFYFNDTNEYPTEFVHKPDSEPVIYTSNNNLYTIYGKKLNTEPVFMTTDNDFYYAKVTNGNTFNTYKFNFNTQQFVQIFNGKFLPDNVSPTEGEYPENTRSGQTHYRFCKA